MKEKKITLTEKMRENPFIAGTLVLGVFCLILIVGGFIQADEEIDGWKDTICEDVARFKVGTPAWFKYDGEYIVSGYIPMENKTLSDLRSYFLNEKIHLVYSESCGWCKKQIEEFEEIGFWEEYKRRDLIINCSR